jgi:predicted DsbA family dithiol-disulfide isomerase
VHWTAFPLHPDTPEDGRSLEDLFAGQPIDIPGMITHLRQTAARLGLPFGDRRQTYNSRAAHEMSKWAEHVGRGEAFHNAVFRAYFADGRNIARMPVLLEIVRSIEGDPLQARAALEQGRYQDAVDRDWQRSRDMGITAVPTFITNGRRLVGAQDEGTLTRFLFPDE